MYEKEQLQALIDTAVDGILSITADGRVRLYNKASERIFGFPPDRVLGQNVSMLMPARFASAHDGYIAHYLTTGEARIIGIGREVEGKRADGTVFPMQLSVGEFAAGTERHFVGIVRDLTAEVDARDRTRSLQNQIELIGRHSAVSEMGAALAHELNQPLTAIDLFLVAAERAMQTDPDKAKALFARVRTEADRAGGIIRRIRQMVERSDGDRNEFSLKAAVEAAADLCAVVDREGQALTVGTIPDERIYGDEVQIRMILVNLLKNALDATAGQPDPRVRLDVSVEADRVLLAVSDNGPGVSEDFEARLFEPFASTKKAGLGIGLSICRTIAEGHGGALRYLPPDDPASRLGGATFRLELPRHG